jgi:flavin-binding protein dodecin
MAAYTGMNAGLTSGASRAEAYFPPSRIRRSLAGYSDFMTNHTYRVTEVVGTSPEGIDTAIRNALARAGDTLRNLDWFEVTQIRGQIDGSDVAHWQVGLKVGFRLDET